MQCPQDPKPHLSHNVATAGISSSRTPTQNTGFSCEI